MKLLRNIFKQNKKSVYSCVIDNSPKFYWQGMIFVTSLIEVAKVDPKCIYIHLLEKNTAFEDFLERKGVNKVFITSWGDKKYCNKLQQIETVGLQKADFVFLCDADIAVLDNLSEFVGDNEIVGKTVDYDNPNINKLKLLFKYFNLAYPLENSEAFTGQPTFDGNFNGGLYGIPGRLIRNFGCRWKCWAEKLLQSHEVAHILAEKIVHIDQVSFCMALQESKIPYRKLNISFNCPTHVKEFTFLQEKLKRPPSVLHFHSNLSSIGLLHKIGFTLVDDSINKVNCSLKKNYESELFWNFRYRVNPLIGSGIGSRGETAAYKVKLLKGIGIERDASILDIGCGDIEVIKQLNLLKYTGVDLSSEALKQAKKKFPQHSFFHLKHDASKIAKSNTVLCLDVLIHQQSQEDYDNLISLLVNKTAKRLIVSGYRGGADKSHMCFFHEDIVASLKKTNAFKYVYKIGGYRGLDVIIADKGELSRQQQNPNDIDNKNLETFLNEYHDIDSELLFESACISRGIFGWYTKHQPRMYEYPWLLEKIGGNLQDKHVADFGAGVTPLPVLLSLRGANVVTLDNNEVTLPISSIQKANEWGYFDYSAIDSSIISLNESLTTKTFKEATLDAWYSISVVEHMPSETRREIFSIMYNSLKLNGKLLLTVDLEKKSKQLWNKVCGQQVENPLFHGSLDTIVLELKKLGFMNIKTDFIGMPNIERVDIATISAEK